MRLNRVVERRLVRTFYALTIGVGSLIASSTPASADPVGNLIIGEYSYFSLGFISEITPGCYNNPGLKANGDYAGDIDCVGNTGVPGNCDVRIIATDVIFDFGGGFAEQVLDDIAIEISCSSSPLAGTCTIVLHDSYSLYSFDWEQVGVSNEWSGVFTDDGNTFVGGYTITGPNPPCTPNLWNAINSALSNGPQLFAEFDKYLESI